MKVTEKITIRRPEEIEVEFDIGDILNKWDLSKNRLDIAMERLEKTTDYPGVVWNIMKREKLIDTEKQEVSWGEKDHFVFLTEKGEDEKAKGRLGIK